MQDLKLKVANLETKGRDYQVFIISKNEWNDKSKEIDKWLRSKFEDKEGTYILPEINGKGLYEFTYKTTGGVIWDILLLLVDKTSKPIIPIYGFVPYVFSGLDDIVQTENSKVFKVVAPDTDEDLTDFVQAELDKFPNGTIDAPTVIEFEGDFWTEGNAEKSKEVKAALHILNKEFFIIRGGTFYTKAPSTPYGGSVNDNNYSRRRHFRFENCKGFKVEPMTLNGSNTTDGELIGTTPETTPEFWKGGKDNGSIGIGFAAYKSYWEFEHGLDFIGCVNFTVDGATINGMWGDGICLGQGNDNFIIRNNKISWCGRQVMALYNCRNGLIEYNEDESCRRGGYDFEPYNSSGYVENIEVRFNKLRPMMTIFPALGNGIVSDINIHHNDYNTRGGTLALYDSRSITRRKNISFRFNKRLESFGSPGPSIKFRMVDNILIEDNYEPLSWAQSRSFASFHDCTGVVVINNRVPIHHYLNGEIEGSANIHINNSEIIAENNIPELEIM